MNKNVKILSILLVVLFLCYSCKKEEEEVLYCTYEIDGFTVDSLNNLPLVNSDIVFAQITRDNYGNVSYVNFHGCKSDSSGYFKLLVENGLISTAAKLQISPVNFGSMYMCSVSPGITHLDTIYFKS